MFFCRGDVLGVVIGVLLLWGCGGGSYWGSSSAVGGCVGGSYWVFFCRGGCVGGSYWGSSSAVGMCWG